MRIPAARRRARRTSCWVDHRDWGPNYNKAGIDGIAKVDGGTKVSSGAESAPPASRPCIFSLRCVYSKMLPARTPHSPHRAGWAHAKISLVFGRTDVRIPRRHEHTTAARSLTSPKSDGCLTILAVRRA